MLAFLLLCLSCISYGRRVQKVVDSFSSSLIHDADTSDSARSPQTPKALATFLTGLPGWNPAVRLRNRRSQKNRLPDRRATNPSKVLSRADGVLRGGDISSTEFQKEGESLVGASENKEVDSSEEQSHLEPSSREEDRLKDELEYKRQLLGAEDPETLVALANYAFKLRENGLLDEAEPLTKDLLAFRRRILGREHADTLIALEAYVDILEQQGQESAAEPLAKELLDSRRKVLGKEHPDTLNALEKYVKILSTLGHELMLEPYMEESLRLTRKIYGPKHPKSQRTWSDYADMLSDSGHTFQAEVMKKEILDLALQSLGPEHAHTLRAIRSYAEALDELGRLDESKQLHDALEQLESQASKSESELPAKAVFAYGTLRGDYSADGDRWGVLQKTGGTWKKGKVHGFRLYQESGAFYPFAAEGEEDDELVGTLLEWSEDEDAEYSVRQCNRIEGFDPENPEDSFYMRSVVMVDIEGEPNPVKAFIYYRRPPSSHAIANDEVQEFPLGDWLQK